MDSFEAYAAEFIFGKDNAPAAALILALLVKIIGYFVLTTVSVWAWLKTSVRVVGRLATWHSNRIVRRQEDLAETIRRVLRQETGRG